MSPPPSQLAEIPHHAPDGPANDERPPSVRPLPSEERPAPPGSVSQAVVAFDRLINDLAAAALDTPSDYVRIFGFRRKVMDLKERWEAGAPAHTPRGAGRAA